MEAARNLSRPQILALESCYLFLWTVRPLLRSLGNQLDETTRANLDATIALALLNEERLMEQFPDLAEAKKRWQSGGAR
jgi:hypothetical protein